MFGTKTGQAGSGGTTPDEPDAAAAATGQPGSRCGSDPSHHGTGGCGVETCGGGSGMSAPIDSWLARIEGPNLAQEGERTLLISGLLGNSLVVSRSGNRINGELGDTVES